VPWFIWLLIAIIALAGEVMSTALVLVYVGVAAAITALLAAANLPPTLQFIVFIPLTLALITIVRPRSLALLGGVQPHRQLSSHIHLVDRVAIVEEEVSDHGGMVRFGTGEFWSARSYPPGTKQPKGQEVRIMYVNGLTAYVSAPTESGRLPDDLELPGADKEST